MREKLHPIICGNCMYDHVHSCDHEAICDHCVEASRLIEALIRHEIDEVENPYTCKKCAMWRDEGCWYEKRGIALHCGTKQEYKDFEQAKQAVKEKFK